MSRRGSALLLIAVSWACVLPGPPPLGGACDLDAGRTCPRGVCIEGRCVEQPQPEDAGCLQNFCVLSVHQLAEAMTDVTAVGPGEAWVTGGDVFRAIDGGLERLVPRLSAGPLFEAAGRAPVFTISEFTDAGQANLFRLESERWSTLAPFTAGPVSALAADGPRAFVASGSSVYRFEQGSWAQVWTVPAVGELERLAVLPGGGLVTSIRAAARFRFGDGGTLGPEQITVDGPVEQLEVQDDGTVWAAMRSGAVLRRAPSGAWTEVVKNADFPLAGGVWVAPSGDLFVCGTERSLLRVRPDGGRSQLDDLVTATFDHFRWVAIAGSGRELWLVGRPTRAGDVVPLPEGAVVAHARFGD